MRQHKVLLLNKKYNANYQSSQTFLNCITRLYMSVYFLLHFYKEKNKKLAFCMTGYFFQKTY